MKVKELLDILNDANQNDNVAFYYLEKDVLNRGEFDLFSIVCMKIYTVEILNLPYKTIWSKKKNL